MIGRLRGELIEKQPPYLLVEVAGVGYELEAPSGSIEALPECGVEVVLYTHLVVREDAHLLYGFLTIEERTMFRTLLKVNGVGAKLALTILSGMSADELARSINDNDSASLVRLPGVGKKTAERLIIEMRDRLDDWRLSATAPAVNSSGGAPSVAAGNPVRDAVSALVALGYRPQEASRLISSVQGEGLDSEALIRAALKQAAPQ